MVLTFTVARQSVSPDPVRDLAFPALQPRQSSLVAEYCVMYLAFSLCVFQPILVWSYIPHCLSASQYVLGIYLEDVPDGWMLCYYPLIG